MKIYSVCMFLLAITTRLWSQDTPRPLQVGISTLLSASVNTVTPPRGWQTPARLQSIPDVYLSTVIPVWQRLGMAVGLDVGLASSGVRCVPVAARADEHELDMRYASIVPSLMFGRFTLGCGVNLPLRGRYITEGGRQSYDSIDLASKSVTLRSLMSTMIDIRAGMEIPFIEDDAGIVSGLFSISYPVGSLFSDPAVSGGVAYKLSGSQAAYDPAVVHVRAGLRYMFSLSHGSGTSETEAPSLEDPSPRP